MNGEESYRRMMKFIVFVKLPKKENGGASKLLNKWSAAIHGNQGTGTILTGGFVDYSV